MRRLITIAALTLSLAACAGKTDLSSIPGTYIVFFETNSAELTPDGYAIVQRAADGARKLRPQGVIVAGYSDKMGSEAANHQIASHRTQIVEKTLTDMGVDPGIITALPLGQSGDRFGPTGDRRIEIRLIRDMSAPPGPEDLRKDMH